MRLGDYLSAIVDDLKDNAPFLKDVGTHGKVFGLDELRKLVILAPACRIALIGARQIGSPNPHGGISLAMGRADTGQFRGPLQMVGFLVEQDYMLEEARDRVIRLADDFMYFLEARTFGLTSDQVGPAFITGLDIMYSAEVDAQGAAIASVTWEQEVWFGRSLHDEDMALLTGDKYGRYPTPHTLYPESDWREHGQLDADKLPSVRGNVTGAFGGDTFAESEEHEPLDADDEEN